jgi:hypothetical protein
MGVPLGSRSVWLKADAVAERFECGDEALGVALGVAPLGS